MRYGSKIEVGVTFHMLVMAKRVTGHGVNRNGVAGGFCEKNRFLCFAESI